MPNFLLLRFKFLLTLEITKLLHQIMPTDHSIDIDQFQMASTTATTLLIPILKEVNPMHCYELLRLAGKAKHTETREVVKSKERKLCAAN